MAIEDMDLTTGLVLSQEDLSIVRTHIDFIFGGPTMEIWSWTTESQILWLEGAYLSIEASNGSIAPLLKSRPLKQVILEAVPKNYGSANG